MAVGKHPGGPWLITAGRTVIWCSTRIAAAMRPTRMPETSPPANTASKTSSTPLPHRNSRREAGTDGPTGFSPEDVDENNTLRPVGRGQRGNGLKAIPAINSANNPYQAVDCLNGGRQKLYRRPSCLEAGRWRPGKSASTPGNGWADLPSLRKIRFTSWETTTPTPRDPCWGNPSHHAADINHSAAAVIADSVTLLSNGWSDLTSMQNPAESRLTGPHARLTTVWRSQAERT